MLSCTFSVQTMVYGARTCFCCCHQVSQGRIKEGTGFAIFDVQYNCVVFRPFKGEVLDTVVTQVNKVRRQNTRDRLQILSSSKPFCTCLNIARAATLTSGSHLLIRVLLASSAPLMCKAQAYGQAAGHWQDVERCSAAPFALGCISGMAREFMHCLVFMVEETENLYRDCNGAGHAFRPRWERLWGGDLWG